MNFSFGIDEPSMYMVRVEKKDHRESKGKSNENPVQTKIPKVDNPVHGLLWLNSPAVGKKY